MVEVAPVQTLTHLSEKVKESLNETREFWETSSADSKLLAYVDIKSELCAFLISRSKKLISYS